MSNGSAEKNIRERILSLIDSEFESDAAFERERYTEGIRPNGVFEGNWLYAFEAAAKRIVHSF